ncbi:MAG: dTDP-4-dehydrorhamnose reductase [Acidobacteria bacterium]|nr:MAG: dTDP-4-dehydrorhamnose reductase [Acidobacteriota bacterium]
MRITIFGATGLLGKHLVEKWNTDEVVGLGSKDADIRDPQQAWNAVYRTHPDWIVLAAAYTDVDGCESNRELAFDVNCHGAMNVARAAKRHGARMLFLSSDYVFDGTGNTPYEVDHQRAPRSVYGQSKAEAEIRLSEIMPDACIVRTSWLFGEGGRCFPDTVLKLATSRSEIDVVDDQRGSPTYAADLAHAIAQLCSRDASGIVHATNRGDCSWFEFAREIVSRAGLTTIIKPTTSDKFVRPAERPKYSVLSSSSLEKYAITMPGWEDALKRYLAARKLTES